MTDYLTVPIEIDQLDVLQLAYDYITTLFPNWVPSEGNLDVAILEAVSTDAASLRELASSVPDTIFRFFGATIVQVAPIDAVAASGLVTFTVVDTAGYTIPGGTQVSIPATGDTQIVFETISDAVIAPGSSTISGVGIQAVDPGADGSGIGSVGLSITLIDSLAFITAVTLAGATVGGSDAEDDETYLNRLVQELQLLSPRLIIPSDFAQDAQNIVGVYRAIAIDGYDPAAHTFGNPREISVVAVDAAGASVDTSIKNAIQASAQAKREVNFIVNVIDPNYTEIDVSFDVIALPGFDTTALHDAIVTAISSWLDPSTWAIDPTTTNPHTWVEKTTLRYLDLVAVVHGVGGVSYINTLKSCVHGGALGTGDIPLTAPAALTTPGTITGTVE